MPTIIKLHYPSDQHWELPVVLLYFHALPVYLNWFFWILLNKSGSKYRWHIITLKTSLVWSGTRTGHLAGVTKPKKTSYLGFPKGDQHFQQSKKNSNKEILSYLLLMHDVDSLWRIVGLACPEYHGQDCDLCDPRTSKNNPSTKSKWQLKRNHWDSTAMP